MIYTYIITSLNMSDNLTIPHRTCVTNELDKEEISRLLIIANGDSPRHMGGHIYCPNEEIQYMVRHTNDTIYNLYSDNVEVREDLDCIVFSAEEF